MLQNTYQHVVVQGPMELGAWRHGVLRPIVKSDGRSMPIHRSAVVQPLDLRVGLV